MADPHRPVAAANQHRPVTARRDRAGLTGTLGVQDSGVGVVDRDRDPAQPGVDAGRTVGAADAANDVPGRVVPVELAVDLAGGGSGPAPHLGAVVVLWFRAE